MSEADIKKLQRQISILQEVLVLRKNGENDSPYVCDNVDTVSRDGKFTVGSAGYAIRKDIKQYINYSWSVLEWLYERDGRYYENDDPRVEEERINMIHTLIARYEAQLGAK